MTRRIDFSWVGPTLVFLVFLGFLGAVGWIIYADANDYRRQCHDSGGHIIEVKDTEICVDRDNGVIFL